MLLHCTKQIETLPACLVSIAASQFDIQILWAASESSSLDPSFCNEWTLCVCVCVLQATSLQSACSHHPCKPLTFMITARMSSWIHACFQKRFANKLSSEEIAASEEFFSFQILQVCMNNTCDLIILLHSALNCLSINWSFVVEHCCWLVV
jgi:hypothetical protein